MKHIPLTILLFLISSLLRADEIPPLTPGKPIDYTKLAMHPDDWKREGYSLELIPWTGKNVVFLTTNAEFDHSLMGIWVSRLDSGWNVYANLTGRLPKKFHQINNKTTIAAVPSGKVTCGYGCGYINAKGIELAGFYDHDYPSLKSHPKAMPHYVFYEMGRNFYTFGNRHSCFTTGFAVFMKYVCMDTLKCEDPDIHSRNTTEGVEQRFAASGLSFLDIFTNTTGKNEKAHRIKDAQGKMIITSDMCDCYASAMLRLRRENGGNEWVKRFFRYLATCPEADFATEAGALKQGWSWLICASIAAKKDLSPVFSKEWHFPMTEDQRSIMAEVKWKQPELTVASVADALARPKQNRTTSNKN
ncbi:MAG: calcium-binding protein [Thermoguttaceae bacterium]|jgi:hypothetical protein